jgi:hypothetical protein
MNLARLNYASTGNDCGVGGTLELEQAASPSGGPSALTIQNDAARALNSPVKVTESPGRRLTLNLLKPSFFSRSREHG